MDLEPYRKNDTSPVQRQQLQFLRWDTCGQERFRSIGTHFARGARAYFFVYDVTNADSFLNLGVWMREVEGTRRSSAGEVRLEEKSGLPGSLG